MGGVSEGSAKLDKVEKTKCHRMTGNVSTENNGGFIQMRTLMAPKIDTDKYQGIYLKVYGNNKYYSIHLRTRYTIAPWQYYSFEFFAIHTLFKIDFYVFIYYSNLTFTE